MLMILEPFYLYSFVVFCAPSFVVGPVASKHVVDKLCIKSQYKLRFVHVKALAVCTLTYTIFADKNFVSEGLEQCLRSNDLFTREADRKTKAKMT